MLAQQKQEIAALFQAALAPIVAGTGLTPERGAGAPARPVARRHRLQYRHAAGQAAEDEPARTGHQDRRRAAGRTRPARAWSKAPTSPAPASSTCAWPPAPSSRWCARSCSSKAHVRPQRSRRRARKSSSNSSRPTRPARCTSATAARPRWATRCRRCSKRRAIDVTREFYYNDAGVQIATLANSVQARARGFKPGDAGWPESAYNGDYIADIADDFLAGKTVSASDGQPATASGDADDLESIRAFAVTYLRNEQDIDLQAFGVKFDNYYLESSLYRDGKVEAAVEALIERRQDLRAGRRAVAAHHRLRRRQGPRDAQVRRHLHLLRAGRGLPHRQVAARLRPGHQHPGQRPPRHHRARARRPAGGRHGHPAGLPRLRAAQDGHRHEGRRRGQDLQARRLLRHGARPDRMVGRRRHRARPRRGALLPHLAQGRHRIRVRRRRRAQDLATRTRCITCSTRMRASARCWRNGAATKRSWPASTCRR